LFERKKIILVTLFVLVFGILKAQNTSYSIKVSAVVVENLQLITIRDLDLLSPYVQGGLIIVNPISNTDSGLFKLKVSPNRTIRINYTLRESIIESNDGIGIVQAVYSMSAAGVDNQSAAFLLTQGTADITIGPQGEAFIWLGAEFDVPQATPGNYLSEFILEFEYL
jgi:hypothetical protein